MAVDAFKAQAQPQPQGAGAQGLLHALEPAVPIHLVQKPRPAGAAGGGVTASPGKVFLDLAIGTRVHRRLRVDEALFQRQRGGGLIELGGQFQHLFQLRHRKVRVVQLELIHEDIQHLAQRGLAQAAADGVHVPAIGCHRRLEVARRAWHLRQQFLQHLHGGGFGFGQHTDEAFLVDAVAAGTAGDLVNFAFGQLAVALAVELGHRAEQHTLDGQVQAHADGVGGHQDVAGAGGKTLGLSAAHLGRQRAVDHRNRVALRGDLVAQHQHVTPAEGHHRIAQLQVGQRHGARQWLHVLLAFKVAHLAAFAAQAQQIFDRSHRVGAADDDDLARRHRHDGLRPGPAA